MRSRPPRGLHLVGSKMASRRRGDHCRGRVCTWRGRRWKRAGRNERGGRPVVTDGRPEFATLEETWHLIHEQWPEPDKIDDAALIYGAAEGMVAAIGDEGHSGFLDPVSAAEMEEAQEAEYVGIGVEVDSRCGVPVVASTMTGSPAEAAGIRPGDVIAEVDEVSTRRMDTRSLRELILGKEGDQLTLTIERPSEANPLRIDVTRQTIERRPVTALAAGQHRPSPCHRIRAWRQSEGAERPGDHPRRRRAAAHPRLARKPRRACPGGDRRRVGISR